MGNVETVADEIELLEGSWLKVDGEIQSLSLNDSVRRASWVSALLSVTKKEMNLSAGAESVIIDNDQVTCCDVRRTMNLSLC